MALPKLNDSPKYEFVIPSTGKKVRFRPYLVKEEKVLMIAAESKDTKHMMGAVLDTVAACVVDDFDVNTLTTFDLEYVFIKLRSKSVGETAKIGVSCQECKHQNDYELNLEEIECKSPKQKRNKIKITEDISVEMKYPGYRNIDISDDANELGFSLIASSIVAVYTAEERIDVSNEPRENLKTFLESMTRSQFDLMAEFLNEMPVVKAHVKFLCKKCSTENEFDIKGIQSFF